MKYSLAEIAKHIGAELLPSKAAVAAIAPEIEGVASIASANSADIIFLEDAKALESALNSKAAAIILHQDSAKLAAQSRDHKPLLVAAHPKLAFARAAALLAVPSARQLGVHATAIVHKNAKIGLGASVGAMATVEDGASVGTRSHIGAGCRIGARVVIGSDCSIAANVTIYSGVTLHDRVIIHAGAVLGSDGFGYVRDTATGKYEKFPQQGRLEIHDDVEIGANCTIDRGALDVTVIGRGSKLDNLVHIGHNVRIGENVVIAAQTGISGSSVIEDEVIIGGQVGIAEHVTIKKGAILGAKCGVPSGKTIQGGGVVYWGIPARPIKQHLKEMALLAHMAKGEKGKKG
jgi:UDP-3-O-[3-hydroxymyristoyl] glucosamine N-acyltransferase